MDKEAILDILKTAESSNKALDITGCLVYHKSSFVQILEGSQNDVHATYLKIFKNPRHKNLKILYEGETKRRSFGKWSMAFHNLDGEDTNKKDVHLFEQNLFLLSTEVDRANFANYLFD